MPEASDKSDQQPLDLKSTDAEPVVVDSQRIPPVVPPHTATPFQFNQVNIQQIPPKVWHKLSPEQIFELSRRIIDQVETMDKRQFDIAKERNATQARSRSIAMIAGGIVAIAGIGASTYLASAGNAIVAGIIATFLATIIAVIVGNKMAGD